MVTYKAQLPEWFDSCLHQNKSRSCSNKCSTVEAEGWVLAGNFTIPSSLAAGAEYIKYCKGYPKSLHILTHVRKSTDIFLHQVTGWFIF